jgi:hypothetical protein
VLWNPSRLDTTPPTLTVPAGITTNATSPLGAAVTYIVSASDNGVDTPVTCTRTSGSTFPIGDTTVVCTATDAAGDTGTGSFTVHVEGAAEQLVDLGAAAAGNGPGTSLEDKVHTAQAYLANGEVTDSCSTLRAFVRQLIALSDKPTLPAPARADALITSAKQIMIVLGCT